MIALPELKNWKVTKDALHQAAQVIGAVRRAVADPRPNWVHLGLQVNETGLVTELPVGEFTLDFAGSAIEFRAREQIHVLGVNGQTQPGLVEAVETSLASSGHPVRLNRDKLHGEGVLRIDPQLGEQYARVLDWAWERLRHVRGALAGYQTDLVLWPHGFDAAFLWFAAPDATDEAQDPHVGIGFSPGSPGLERPYFFVYVWPLPDALTERELPEYARWHTEGWTGAIINYDDVRQLANADTVVEETLRGILDVVAI